MPEHININLLVSDGGKLPSRRLLILNLLALLPQDLGTPNDFVFLNVETNQEVHYLWGDATFGNLDNELSETTILTVYLKSPTHSNSTSISINEAFCKTLINISIPLAKMAHSINLVEKCIRYSV